MSCQNQSLLQIPYQKQRGMNAASSVRRSMNRDSHVKDSVLTNSKKPAKKVAVYVRKNKKKISHPKTVVQIVLWIIDSGCSKHMTGDRSLLKNFIEKFMGTVHFGNDNFAAITGLWTLPFIWFSGPMRVALINGKKYILVIMDNYSRYTWVYFLHFKRMNSRDLKKFIAQAQTDYKAKFAQIVQTMLLNSKIATLKAHYENVWHMQQFSTARMNASTKWSSLKE
ncbi:retrovirus-related pol polyprotein from transposon TNT 1-94 [Tanacetum coccineum]